MLQGMAKCFSAKIKEKLVTPPGIDVNSLHRAQRLRMRSNHTHRVPGQPTFPHLGNEHTGRGIVGQANGAILVGGVTGGHARVSDYGMDTRSRKSWATTQSLPER